MPKRIQLRRTKGWRMPPGALKVDRSSKFGNSYRVGDRVYTTAGGWKKIKDAAEAVAIFRRREVSYLPNIATLRGKDLGCWCKLCAAHQDGKPFGEECADCAPCHADVLGEVANRPLVGVPDA